MIEVSPSDKPKRNWIMILCPEVWALKEPYEWKEGNGGSYSRGCSQSIEADISGGAHD